MTKTILRTLGFALLVSSAPVVWGGETGKIAGQIVDASTKEGLPGVNVVLEGTTVGAATDYDGNFVIGNIRPGIYNVRVTSVGYNTVVVTGVKVSVDLTTRLDAALQQTTIDLTEIVVTAERPLVQRDLTSSSSRVSADQIQAYPVEDIHGLVNLQAGVVDGHFRGGRGGEVLYLIDGVPVNDVYSGDAGVSAENLAIQELEIISGTFNAEYGQAMSGVVNQITKEGGDRFAGEVSAYVGDYVSGHKDLFMNVDNVRPTDIRNIQGNLSGPIPIFEDATFFVSARAYYDDGYLYGKRIFVPTDSSDFSSQNPDEWYVGASGDGAYVPLNFEDRTSLQAKVAVRIFGSDKIWVQGLQQKRLGRSYDHRFKYNPDGAYHNVEKNSLLSLGYTIAFSPASYLEVRGAWFSSREDSYVYEDPYDPRFPDYRRALAVSGAAFLTGGAQDQRFHRESRSLLFKADFSSQVTTEHNLKTGVEVKHHRIWIHNFGIQNDQTTNFQPRPVEFGRSEFANTIIRPQNYAFYLQDKMEFEDIIVNAGLRFDLFRPQSMVLAEPLKLGRDRVVSPAADERKFSPRLGLAFPITDRGILHLSYGHFFQIPPFDLLYLNPAFNINATEAFQVGNPGLKSQTTIAYELGLQQQLSDDIAIDMTVYYKDVRNLIGTEIFDIGNGNKYSKFVNRDYGMVRGVIISFEKRHSSGFSATLDYTYQIAKGNASDPNSVFLDNQTDPPRESQKQLAPLDWDRRHSLNGTATIGDPRDFSATIIGRLGSGLPYTPAYQNQRTGLLNSDNRPIVVTVDLYASKSIRLFDRELSFFAKVYNIFDTKNELQVFTDTGRAGQSLEQNVTGSPRGINTIAEYYVRPEFFSSPRQVLAGVRVGF